MHSRVKFIFVTLFLLFANTHCAHLSSGSNQLTSPLSIMQGHSNKNSAQFNVLVPRKAKLNYFYKVDQQENPILNVKRKDFQSSNWSVDHLSLANLSLNKNYELIVKDSSGKIYDQRNFTALDTDKNAPRIMVASCSDDRLIEVAEKIWPEALAKTPDIIFLIGDNVYGDRNLPAGAQFTPLALWQRYVESRQRIPLYFSKTLVPVLAARDDHDYGLNNGGRDFEYKKESAEIFQSFFAQKANGTDLIDGPGVAAAFFAFQQKFIFLDNRSYRSPNDVDSLDQTHFGDEQESWLIKLLNKGKDPAWLISGDQFFGAYHKFESYEGNHLKSFQNFLQRVGKASSRVIFVSGDRHLAEIMKVSRADFKYPTYEITTSAIHAKLYPGAWDETKNPRQISGVSGEYNYAIIKSRSLKNKFNLDVKVYGLNNKLFFEKQLQ